MVYENKVIIYLDMLGFKDFISHSSKSIHSDKIISKTNSLFLFLKGILKENVFIDTQNRSVSHFSDTIVISFSSTDQKSIYDELKDVQLIIGNCILNDLFMRGSVVYGNIIHNDNVIFGPGLIEAYETENKIAIYPRIVVDNSIVKDYESINECEFSIDDILSIDTDGLHYIDYFTKIRPHLDSDDQYKKYILKFTEMLLSIYQKPLLKDKLKWLFPKYHKMLIDINIINREEMYKLSTEDLKSIYFTMKTEWD